MSSYRLRALIVEDDEDDYIKIRDILSKLPQSHFDIVWVTSGKAALDELEPDSYDVCLIDCQLGSSNGLELLSALRERELAIPVILLSDHDDRWLDTRVMDAGAADFLVKGRLSADILEKSIRCSIKHKNVEKQLRQKAHDLSTMLDKAEAQLYRARTLEAIGALAGGIAHDLNNVLGASMLFTELAMEDIPRESTARKDLDEVLKSCRRGKSLLDQVLAFSRARGGESQPVQLGPIVKEILGFLRACLPASIEIVSRFDIASPESDLVFADPMAIHELLLKVGAQAASAMRESGGVMSVSLTSALMSSGAPGQMDADLRPAICLRLDLGGSGNGTGAETIEQFLASWHTPERHGNEAGGGLFMAQGGAAKHQGGMEVRLIPGESALEAHFTAIIPEPWQKSDEPAELSRANEEILLIDDDPMILKAGLRILQSLGYQATGSSSPADALKVFGERPEHFDIVITDLTMPLMQGTELARELASIRPGIPIILYTGYGHYIDEAEAEAAGIKKILEKPLGREDYARAIGDVLQARERSQGAFFK